jgi:hypothetical protein
MITYRAYTGYTHSKGVTAADVIRYERDTLGNRIDIPDRLLDSLENDPAEAVIWVTYREEDALRYGTEIEEIDIPSDALLIAEDGDGGYLYFRFDI